MTGTYRPAADTTGLLERTDLVLERIKTAARRSGRADEDVRLVAVSKTVTRASVNAAYHIGLRDFGENRVPDALEKFREGVPDDLTLHMIGPIQSNKVRQIVGHFDLVHSIDRKSLLKEFQKRASEAEIVQDLLIQVNVGREPQKHGCDVDVVTELLEYGFTLPAINIRGFMAMAPFVDDAEETRPVFAEMRELAERMRSKYPAADLTEMSMGMTNDFGVAIEEGSTIVRVGRAIFHPEFALS